MGSSERHPVEAHVREYRPPAGKYTLWSCISRSPRNRNDGVLGDDFYWQVPAGIVGIGLFEAVAKEVEGPHAYTRWGVRVHDFAIRINGLLRGAGIDAVTHDRCAIRDNVVGISKDIAEGVNHGAVLARSQEFHHQLTSERFSEISQAVGRIASKQLIADPGTAYRDLTGSRQPIRTAWLDKDYSAIAFVANWRKGVVLDTRTAAEQGLAVYHTSLGDLSQVHAVLEPHTGTRLATLQEVAAVFLGDISTRLLGPDEKMLPIHYIPKGNNGT